MKIPASYLLTSIISLSIGACLFALVPHGKTLASPSEAQVKPAKIMYHCPMHPEVIRDHAGTCPICGMTLVPMTNHEHAGPDRPMDAVKVDAAMVQSIGVKTAMVMESDLHKPIHLVGAIAMDSSRRVLVNARVMGWIETLNVGAEGQVVQKGQTLLELYSPELVAAQEDYLQAIRTQDSLLVKSARKRLQVLAFPSNLLDSLSIQKIAFRTIPIVAPIAGVVLKKSVIQGQNIAAGSDLFEIVDLSHLWVVGTVYPNDVAVLKVGLQARVNILGRNEMERQGRVQYIAPIADPQSKTVNVRVEISNTADFQFKPGMNADLWIDIALGKGIAIPEQAIIRTGMRTVAIVALGDGYYAPRTLRLGESFGDSVQVLDGLHSMDTVVTSAQFLIDGESNLKKAVEGFSH